MQVYAKLRDEPHSEPEFEQGCVLSEMPAKRMDVEGRVAYVSAIAHKWSSLLQQPPIELAAAIIHQARSVSPSASSLPLPFSPGALSTQSPGWIIVSIPDDGVITWLQHMLAIAQRDLVYHMDEGMIPGQSANHANLCVYPPQAEARHRTILHSQYAHARCCAWLRLAADAGISPEELSIENLYQEAAFLVNKNLFPWMHGSGESSNRATPLMSLVITLMDVVDEMSEVFAGGVGEVPDANIAFEPSLGSGVIQQRAIKWAMRLGEVVLRVQADLPLMGVIRRGDRPLAECALCLVLIAKSLLKSILHDCLHCVAPTAL